MTAQPSERFLDPLTRFDDFIAALPESSEYGEYDLQAFQGSTPIRSGLFPP
jgi:hypothetical protein